MVTVSVEDFGNGEGVKQHQDKADVDNRAAVNCYRPEVPWDDLLPNILNRLPLDSLCRFLCVSKSWRSYILHNFDRSQRQPITCCCVVNNDVHLYSIDQCGVATHICNFVLEVDALGLQFCNSLVCYRCSFLDIMLVYNPKIQEERVVLPKSLVLPKSTICIAAAVDNFQFMFDPSSNKYKVLDLNNYPHCQIFTLGTTSWRPITSTIDADCNKWRLKNPACIGTMMYWDNVETNMILTFDLVHERFSLIQGPKLIGDGAQTNIFEFEGCLCLAQPRISTDEDCHAADILDLWMLKDGNPKNAWVMIKSVKMPKYYTSCNPILTRRGEILLAASWDRQTLYFYNLLTHQFDAIRVNGTSGSLFCDKFCRTFN